MKINVLLNKIESSKAKIAKERDRLWAVYGDLEDLLESCDDGIESIESGKREIESGIDFLSKFL